MVFAQHTLVVHLGVVGLQDHHQQTEVLLVDLAIQVTAVVAAVLAEIN